MIRLVFLLLLTTAIPTLSQEVIWQKSFGGAGEDWGNAIVPTSDGGFIGAGLTTSFKSNPSSEVSLYVVRTDANGEALWEKSLSALVRAEARGIFDLGDGRFQIIGMGITAKTGDGNVRRIYSAIIDGGGNLLSEKVVGDSIADATVSIVRPISTGGYIVVGTQSNKIMAARLASNGDVLWQRTYQVAVGKDTEGTGIRETADGGFVVAGYTSGSPAIGYDAVLMRVSNEGDSLWSRLFGTSAAEYGYDVIERTNGSLMLIGRSASAPGEYAKIYTVHTDRNGVFESSAKVGAANDIQVIAIERTHDGGILMVGAGGGSSPDVLLVKTDADGRVQWEKTFEVGTNTLSTGLAVRQLSDNSYVVTGSGGKGLLIMRVSEPPSAVGDVIALPSVLSLW